jgi:hypothetical protein
MNTQQPVPSPEERINAAVYLILEVGGIDGAHHKQWTLDQVLRVLTGDGYASAIAEYEQGADGPKTYEWDTGIAP